MDHAVCPLTELRSGSCRVVELDNGLQVGVALFGDRLVAYENTCAHQGGPVCLGVILPRTKVRLGPEGTALGEYVAPEEPRLVCPWHSYEYDLLTGVCAADPDLRLRPVEVFAVDGQVMVRTA